ncbi:beta-lactamase [Verrucomicrobiia bacterium DG1235]|nr:beta-lactamase [Verrucomicrobiae bacterium DG1235]
MNKLYQNLQHLLDKSSVELGSVGLMARIESRDLVWNGVSKEFKKSDVERGFYICSLSKSFTAVAILRLVEEGMVTLDDVIADHLNGVDCYKNITLRQLLNHSSRIQDYVLLDGYLNDVYASPENPWTDSYIIDRVKKLKLVDPSDFSSHYSNTGYLLLKQILELVTGEKYHSLLSRLVIEPMGLKRTYVATELDESLSLLPAFDNGFKRFGGDIRPQYHPGWCATGVVVSTLEEICLFYSKILSGELISESSLSAMLDGIETPYWLGPNDAPYNGKLSNGLGMKICRKFSVGKMEAFYGHGGDCPGYSVWAGCADIGNERITCCVVSNRELESPPEVIWMKLIENVLSQQNGDHNSGSSAASIVTP